MYGLREMLIQEKEYLERIILNTRKMQDATAPDGWLRISKDGNRFRFYHCTNGRYGTYIAKDNKKLACQLAQKDYNDTVLKKAEYRLKLITKIVQDYSDNEIEQIYTSLHEERQAMVTPVEATAEQLEKQWYDLEYTGKTFAEGTSVILTEKGERVRSKSEKILADYFFRKGILYKYEKPLVLAGYGTVYPDFTFFSKKLRKEIYWEHEGMMDKAEYVGSAVKKINSYQLNGIFPGERLILTYETEQETLNSKVVSGLVEKYLGI